MLQFVHVHVYNIQREPFCTVHRYWPEFMLITQWQKMVRILTLYKFDVKMFQVFYIVIIIDIHTQLMLARCIMLS